MFANKAAEAKEKIQKCSLWLALMNPLPSNAGSTKHPENCQISERKKWQEVGLAAVSLPCPAALPGLGNHPA